MASLQKEVLLRASAAATTTNVTATQNNGDGFDILEVVVDLSAFTTTASLTVSIQEYLDGLVGASGANWVTVLASTAMTATGQKRLTIGPVVPTAANASMTTVVPLQWRVLFTHGNANSHTYSAHAKLVRLSPKSS